MIKLEVKDYCHNCPNFIADVTPPETVEYHTNGFVSDEVYMTAHTDTVVRCKEREKCESIMKYLKNRG